jgi:iron uptake system component EfeO
MQSLSSRRRRALATVGTLGVVAVTLAGCSGGESGDASTPAASAGATKGGVTEVGVTLTSGSGSDTCDLSSTTAPAGPVTFKVTNKDSAAISEVELLSNDRIVGEKENLAPGLAPVSFTVTLGGGTYQVYCPGADKDTVAFTVTGAAAATPTGGTADLLTAGTKDYAQYVDGQVAAMVVAVQNLQKAVDSGDLQATKEAYATARPFYEKIESDVDGFVLPGYKPTDNKGNLDYLIDMRASSLDPKVGWHGFHAIERDVFQGGKITPTTKQYAAELTSNVKKLSELSKGLTYKPEDLANGASDLLEEVQANKITGEEEKYSHLDLATFAGNVEGAEQAFADLQPALTKIDPDLTAQVTQQFAAVHTALEGYKDPNELGGYELWTAALRKKDAAKLSQDIQALQQPLSQIAEKVATAQ